MGDLRFYAGLLIAGGYRSDFDDIWDEDKICS